MHFALVDVGRDVFRVDGAPANVSIECIASAVDRFVNTEWPCPMMTYGATRYCVTARLGRQSNAVYVRIGLS